MAAPMSLRSLLCLSARCVAAALLLPASLAGANPNPDRPTQLEALQLPKYCHKEYGIPSNVPMPTEVCGHLMNHFCKGQVFINRAANLTAPKGARQQAATRARSNIDYSKRGMPAGCPLAGEVNAADVRLRAIEMFLK